MNDIFLIALAIIGGYAVLGAVMDFISRIGNKNKEIDTDTDVKVKKVKVVGSFNRQVDNKYDELISNIVSNGEVIGIDEYRLYFKYQNREYGIWIANKDCAYGNKLESKSIWLVNGRGIRQSTANLLYKKELAYITLTGKVITTKTKEDAFISSMLEDN